MKIHFGHCVGKYELRRDFFARIGPLQLGVVLVSFYFYFSVCLFVSCDVRIIYYGYVQFI